MYSKMKFATKRKTYVYYIQVAHYFLAYSNMIRRHCYIIHRCNTQNNFVYNSVQIFHLHMLKNKYAFYSYIHQEFRVGLFLCVKYTIENCIMTAMYLIGFTHIHYLGFFLKKYGQEIITFGIYWCILLQTSCIFAGLCFLKVNSSNND